MVIKLILLVILFLIITVIISVYENKRLYEEIESLRYKVRDLNHLLKKDREDINILLNKIDRADKDIEAIAEAINVYSRSINGSVEEMVKDNVNLFNEWILGEEE